MHGFETGFKEELFKEGIADLNVGTLGLGGFAELFAGHGRAVDPVPAGLGANVNDGIADAGRLGVENLALRTRPMANALSSGLPE